MIHHEINPPDKNKPDHNLGFGFHLWLRKVSLIAGELQKRILWQLFLYGYCEKLANGYWSLV